MKRLVGILAAAAALATGRAMAGTWTDAYGTTWTYEVQTVYDSASGECQNQSITLKRATTTQSQLSVPAQIGQVPVVGIRVDYVSSGSSGHYVSLLDDNTSVTSVDVLDGIRSIGPGAFVRCRNLTRVTLPNSVTTIGANAFKGCSQLTGLSLPSGLTRLAPYVFQNCTNLVSLTLPSGVTTIGKYALSGCSNLTRLTLPNGVTTIETNAFQNCSRLTSLTLPNSVTKVEDGAFSGCSGLTSLTLPNGLTAIGWGAFEGCSGLTSLTLPNGLSEIDRGAFEGCSGLTSLTLPNGLTAIGREAFRGCSGLTSLTLPNNVTTIGESAFRGCSGLTSLTLPGRLKTIEAQAFQYCDGLTSLTLPNGLTAIGDGAFYDCSRLTSVTIPASVEEIGSEAFADCPSLRSVVLPRRLAGSLEWNVFRRSARAVLTYYDGATPPQVDTGAADEVVIPNTSIDIASEDELPVSGLAEVYNGYLVDDEDEVKGTVMVKVGKLSRATGRATVTATVQPVGGQKLMYKAAQTFSLLHPTTVLLKGPGGEMSLELSENGLWGEWNGYLVGGARNIFTSRTALAKGHAADFLRVYKGAFTVVLEEDDGFACLSVAIGAKGKVKVTGTLSDGRKVSVASQAIVGDGCGVIPVVDPKGVCPVFLLTLPGYENVDYDPDATYADWVDQISMSGNGSLGALATPEAELTFSLTGEFAFDEAGCDFCGPVDVEEVYEGFLPNVTFAGGRKWKLPKAGAIRYSREDEDYVDVKDSENPAGLKLTYAARTGTFKGSFFVYTIKNGKLKKYKATVTGVMCGAEGYGTATIRGVGSVGVHIE